MAKVVALFQTQAEASGAMDELAQMHLEDVETAVYEGQSGGGDSLADRTAGVFIPPVGGTTSPLPPIIPVTGGAGLDIDDEEEEYFRQGYAQGGTIVVVDARNEDEQHVRHVLNSHGGRFFSRD